MKKLNLTQRRRFAVTGLMVAMLLVSAASFLMAGKDKESGHGFLGVNIDQMTSGDREEFGVRFGILVTRVSEGEAAEKAGIRKYDVIQYFNDERIRRPGDLTEVVRRSKPGSKATIKLIRDGKNRTVTATLGETKHSMFFSRGGNKFIWKDKSGKHDLKKFLHKGDNDFVYRSKGFNLSGGFLGVHLQSLSNNDFAKYFGVKADEGALVTSVGEDTPAEKAGLKAGDVITSVDGKEISSPSDISKLLHKKEKGDKVAINFMRHKKKKTVTAELAQRKGLGHLRIFGSDTHRDIHIKGPNVFFRSGDHDGDLEEIIIEKKLRKKKENKIKKEEKHVKKIRELIKKREKSSTRTNI